MVKHNTTEQIIRHTRLAWLYGLVPSRKGDSETYWIVARELITQSSANIRNLSVVGLTPRPPIPRETHRPRRMPSTQWVQGEERRARDSALFDQAANTVASNKQAQEGAITGHTVVTLNYFVAFLTDDRNCSGSGDKLCPVTHSGRKCQGCSGTWEAASLKGF